MSFLIANQHPGRSSSAGEKRNEKPGQMMIAPTRFEAYRGLTKVICVPRFEALIALLHRLFRDSRIRLFHPDAPIHVVRIT
jgi:hypothetical protein